MKNFSKLLVFIGLSFVLSANAFADVAEEIFDRGYKAFVEKDYSGAEKHWKRSGDLGHVRSQMVLVSCTVMVISVESTRRRLQTGL